MNIGSHASLRESCDLCRGRYRVHVDADDWILDDSAFQQQVELLESNPRVTFVYSRMTLTGPHGESVHTSRPYRTDIVLPGALALEEILGFNITHSGMMFRLDAYEQSGGYPAGYKHADDMLLAVRLAELGDVAYIDQELYAFRQHGSNIHFDPDLVMVRTEILPIIDLAFGGPLGKEVPHASRVRRRVTGRLLVHGATQNIFSGRLRTGWSLYWRSARLRPITTIFQRRTLSLLARTVLGSRGFALVRQVIGRRSRRSADRVPTRHRA